MSNQQRQIEGIRIDTCNLDLYHESMDSPVVRYPKKMIIVGGIVLILIVIAIVVLSVKKDTSKKPSASITPSITQQNPNPQVTTTSPHPEQGVVAKVGNEYIYDTDLDYELTYYPSTNASEAHDILLNKMIEDSVILQGAQADGLITLDATIFNSRSKEYDKRIQAVNQIKDKLDQRATFLEGAVIAIWFNNMGAGAAGYEKGKQTALAEITRLQKEVKEQRISMQQAGYQIKSNVNLQSVDSSYKANAYFDFSITDNQKITYSPVIDEEIFKLNQGQVSEVLTGKDINPETGAEVDSVYMVAQVTKRGKKAVTSYDQWLGQKTKEYAVEKF